MATPTRSIKIRSTSELDQIEGGFDLIVNVDSLTEMQREVAQNYWEYAKKATRTILSINHEANPIVIRSLYEGDPTLDVTPIPLLAAARLRRGGHPRPRLARRPSRFSRFKLFPR